MQSIALFLLASFPRSRCKMITSDVITSIDKLVW